MRYYTIYERKNTLIVSVKEIRESGESELQTVLKLKMSTDGTLGSDSFSMLSSEEIDGLEEAIPELDDIWDLIRRMDLPTKAEKKRFFIVSPCMVDDDEKAQLLKELEEIKIKIAAIEQRLEVL